MTAGVVGELNMPHIPHPLGEVIEPIISRGSAVVSIVLKRDVRVVDGCEEIVAIDNSAQQKVWMVHAAEWLDH
jgi:hypothetical protein